MCAACPQTVTPPGDEQMGKYVFGATEAPVPSGQTRCPFREIPDAGFSFEAYFSRNKDPGTTAWVTIGAVPHEATFDGQVITAQYGAQRNFADCSACPNADGGRGIVTMTENITTTIVSKSQSDAVMGCSITPPFDPDAGITRPGTTESGFDALRACGQLTEHVTLDPPVLPEQLFGLDGGCTTACNDCSLAYDISGDRR